MSAKGKLALTFDLWMELNIYCDSQRGISGQKN